MCRPASILSVSQTGRCYYLFAIFLAIGLALITLTNFGLRESKEESAERSFQRLEELKRSDEAYQAVDAALGEAFERYFKGPDARKTLIAWTAEAALGLGLPEAKVASCLATRIDESMLKEAEALLEERCGIKVVLTPSDEAPLPGLGVRLSSLDDKVYYDNRLSVRLVRKSRSVRKIIQECTCKIG